MATKFNLYRILFFSVFFFLCILIVHNVILTASFNTDNMITLLYIRKDNLTGTSQGELYPVALYSKGIYFDVSADVSDHAIKAGEKELALSRIKDFAVVEGGRKLGIFHVDAISPSPFMCSNILTGKGNLKDGKSLSDMFNLISDSRCSLSKGFNGQKEFDYSLKWTLATSKVNKVRESEVVITDKDIERYRTDLLNIGTSLLAGYVSDDDGESNSSVVLQNLSSFDLDHDGKPEISAKLKKMIKKKTKVYQGTKEWEECSNDVVYLNLWVTYKNGSPNVILSLISYEKEGSWGNGHDLVGTVDIDGDGTEEVIMRSSGWEVVEFEIYAYRNDKLERVFHGAGFGC